MLTVAKISAFLEQFAPTRLAEDWDNVGLLVGDRNRDVDRVMTCLTVTPASAGEAVARRADLIVAHHPMPFRPVKRMTADTTVGRLLLDLIAAQIAVYSPHTAFDSAEDGINQRLAVGLGLQQTTPLVCRPDSSQQDGGLGAGRFGPLPEPLTLGQLAQNVKRFLSVERMQMVGRPQQPVGTLAVACGAAGTLLDAARQAGCDGMVLGETSLHTCLEAEATGVGLLLPGHFASERFAVEHLADVLSRQFPQLEVWASGEERDPVRWV